MSVPRREPELVAAEAKRLYHGDDEKVPTTSLRQLIARGIMLQSRYKKAHELDLMEKVINAMCQACIDDIASVWCDSQATARFSVVLRNWNEDRAYWIGQCLDHLLIRFNGGHNGITVVESCIKNPSGGDRRVDVDPNWNED